MHCSSGLTTHITFGENFLSSFNLLLGPIVLHQEPLQNSYFPSLPYDTPTHLGELALLSSHALLIFSPGASKPRKSDDFEKTRNMEGQARGLW